MEAILKAAEVGSQPVNEEELALINRQTLRPLAADDVFTFRLAACDNQVDRDWERFTDGALEGLAGKFVGKSVLQDHKWSSGAQTARVYAAGVEEQGAAKRLILRCYMPRTDSTRETITRIETGILRECSVGCSVERAVCSICGADQRKTCCVHTPGNVYEGKRCVMELDGAEDAFEVSMVAVPAQRDAGVVKSKRYGGEDPEPVPTNPPEPKEKTTGEPANMMGRLAAMMNRKDEEK